jgi:2,3-bisphosphoglycerate-independent phosphoglycerate mutase
VNPFLRARLPVLAGLLGGIPVRAGSAGVLAEMEGGAFDFRLPERPAAGSAPPPRGRLVALDARLGVEGLPQSGTGQIALLTGANAPQLFGRHFGPWPPSRLRPLLSERSFLRRAVDEGLEVVFANAYPEGFPGDRSSRRVAAPPLAAAAAGLLTRHHEALARGEAVASEIVNEGWRRHLGFDDLPEVAPPQAGRNLAALARTARLTFFAHYLTDVAGHRGGMTGAIEALERVDAFLGGVLEQLDSDTLLLVVSDHGNIEDVRGGHTLNPALGIALGPGSEALALGEEIPLTRLAPFILERLGV